MEQSAEVLANQLSDPATWERVLDKQTWEAELKQAGEAMKAAGAGAASAREKTSKQDQADAERLCEIEERLAQLGLEMEASEECEIQQEITSDNSHLYGASFELRGKIAAAPLNVDPDADGTLSIVPWELSEQPTQETANAVETATLSETAEATVEDAVKSASNQGRWRKTRRWIANLYTRRRE